MTLTNNFNYLQPTGFRLVIDRTNYPNLEFFVQDFTHAGVIMNTADLQYKKLAAIPFIGDKLTYNEMLANIILDEDMKAYTEMHDWMRRILDEDNLPKSKRIFFYKRSMADMNDPNYNGDPDKDTIAAFAYGLSLSLFKE